MTSTDAGASVGARGGHTEDEGCRRDRSHRDDEREERAGERNSIDNLDLHEVRKDNDKMVDDTQQANISIVQGHFY